MSYSITIRAKGGLFAKGLATAQLKKQFGAVVRIGGIGMFCGFEDELQPPPDGCEAAYMLQGASSPPGRGFYLYVEKGYSAYELVSPLPTTRDDLQDLFSFAGTLARHLNIDRLQDDRGHTVTRAALASLYPEIAKENGELLKSYAISRPDFVVSGVKYPLRLPPALCQRMANVPAENAERFFAAWLYEKQAVGYAYLKPQFFQTEEGDARGVYTIDEGVGAIIPKKPFLPYGPNPLGDAWPAVWQAVLMSANIGPLATLLYDEFLQRLEEKELSEFDEDHYLLRALPLKRLQELAGSTQGA